MNEKKLILAAKTLSTIFSPFYTPIWVLLGLFLFSYLKMLPFSYKLFILSMVYIFTILIPRACISMFKHINRQTNIQLSSREHRHLPYILTLISYTVCFILMTRFNVPMFFKGIVMAALVAQIICVMVNAWWKISTHMVGIGGLTGALLAFSSLFYFNPVIPACVLIIIAGALGTSRIILRQHSVSQVAVGFFVGLVCSMVFILKDWM